MVTEGTVRERKGSTEMAGTSRTIRKHVRKKSGINRSLDSKQVDQEARPISGPGGIIVNEVHYSHFFFSLLFSFSNK